MNTSVVGPRRSSKALAKAKLALKKGSWSLFHGLLPVWSTTVLWIPAEKCAQQIDEINQKLQHLQNGTCQQKGPSSSPRKCPTKCCTTNASKVEWIGLRSFASPSIFTWPLTNWLPLLQASRQLFAGKMLPQPAGDRRCFPRKSSSNPIHRFLCYRNKQTYFSLAKMCWFYNGSYFD